ncbi:MAG TPA: DUF5666 domain-containing protein [Burkholderiales bacterium]|nr:DUF5666 domain-containing protein [Burkholderiales bacterium]
MPGRGILKFILLGLLFLPASLFAANACVISPAAIHPSGGIGGTGLKEGGIGGTGHSGEGGIGGTGVVGVITGFGSVCVNGLEVQYHAATRVEVNSEPASLKDLSVGQVVVMAAKGAPGKLSTDLISVVNVVAGRITSQDASGIQILGQTVISTPQTLLAGKPAIGDFVRVSGFRLSSGEIVASRIDVPSASAESSVSGPITAMEGDMIEIYGLKITGVDPRNLSVGKNVIVSGNWNGQSMTASKIVPDPFSYLATRMQRLNLQGFIDRRLAPNKFSLSGIEVEIPASASVAKGNLGDVEKNEFIQVSGKLMPDHRLEAERIEFAPEIRNLDIRDFPAGRPEKGEGRPENPENDRMEQMQLDRPNLPERPEVPDRPEIPQVPEIPEHIDRPQIPQIEVPFRAESPH